MMKKMSAFALFGFSLILIQLCSCATRSDPPFNAPASVLPVAVSFNPDAGRDEWLFVNLQLQSGETLQCFVDTGSPVTVFDKSFESKLGQPLGAEVYTAFGATH